MGRPCRISDWAGDSLRSAPRGLADHGGAGPLARIQAWGRMMAAPNGGMPLCSLRGWVRSMSVANGEGSPTWGTSRVRERV